jgi:hypothetical protein
MVTAPPPESLDKEVRVLQIIVGALIAGVLAFAVVALAMGGTRQAGDQQHGAGGLISMVAAGLAVMMVVTRETVGPLMANAQVRQIAAGTWPGPGPAAGAAAPGQAADAGRLLAVFRAVTIVQTALPEAAAIFNILAYLLEGEVWSLAIAAGLVLWMALSLPTRGRVMQWLDRQMEALEQLRSGSQDR